MRSQAKHAARKAKEEGGGGSVEDRKGIYIKRGPADGTQKNAPGGSGGGSVAGGGGEVEEIGYACMAETDEASRRYNILNRPFEMIDVGVLRELLAQDLTVDELDKVSRADQVAQCAGQSAPLAPQFDCCGYRFDRLLVPTGRRAPRAVRQEGTARQLPGPAR